MLFAHFLILSFAFSQRSPPVPLILIQAMISFLVYFKFEAYIKGDDDIVSAFAQGQLVLIYFGSLAIFASDEAEQKTKAFTGSGFGVVLVLIFFSSSIVAICVIVLEIFGYSDLGDAFSKITKKTTRKAVPLAVQRGESTDDDDDGDDRLYTEHFEGELSNSLSASKEIIELKVSSA